MGVTGLPSDDAVLRAVVEHDGGDYARGAARVTIGFSAVPSLIAGRVDAVVAFWNAEGVALRRRGVRTREFRVDDYGAPRYPELVLATERETLRRAPRAGATTLVAALARRARAAALRRPRRRGGRDRGGVGRATSRWCAPSSTRWRPRCARRSARPRRARGLGPLRRALRDPRAPARRASRRVRRRADVSAASSEPPPAPPPRAPCASAAPRG